MPERTIEVQQWKVEMPEQLAEKRASTEQTLTLMNY